MAIEDLQKPSQLTLAFAPTVQKYFFVSPEGIGPRVEFSTLLKEFPITTLVSEIDALVLQFDASESNSVNWLVGLGHAYIFTYLFFQANALASNRETLLKQIQLFDKKTSSWSARLFPPPEHVVQQIAEGRRMCSLIDQAYPKISYALAKAGECKLFYNEIMQSLKDYDAVLFQISNVASVPSSVFNLVTLVRDFT